MAIILYTNIHVFTAVWCMSCVLMKYFIIKYNFTMNAVVDNQCGVVNKMAATSFCFQSVS